VAEGASDKAIEEINAEHGQWEVVANIDHNLGMVLARDQQSRNAFLVNKKLGLNYTADDLAARRPLPAPYPYPDDGVGLFFPNPADPQKGRLLAPIAHGVQDRFRRGYHGMGGLGGYARTIHLSGNRELLRDAAVSLIRYAYQFPTIDSANYLTNSPSLRASRASTSVAASDTIRRTGCPTTRPTSQPFATTTSSSRSFRATRRWPSPSAGFVPWVETSADLIKLLDVYLIQATARRTLRYLDHTHPTAIADLAAALDDPSVTDPWMEWLFARTFVYPLPPRGIQDVMVSGHDREGRSTSPRPSTAGVRAPRAWRRRSTATWPRGRQPEVRPEQPGAVPEAPGSHEWLLRVLVAGCDRARIGDVSGPGLRQGDSLVGLDETVRTAWRWSGDPRFAWLVRHVNGRKGDSDADWQRIEEAAARLPRAPWLDNRSRAVENWFGALETASSTTTSASAEPPASAQVRAPAISTATRSTSRSSPTAWQWSWMAAPAAATRSRMTGRRASTTWSRWMARTTWPTAGCRRFRRAGGALPPSRGASPPACSLFSRQTALVDVEEGQGSKPLAVELQKPERACWPMW